MSAITRNYKNSYRASTIQDRDLEWKLNTTKFRSMFGSIWPCVLSTYVIQINVFYLIS